MFDPTDLFATEHDDTYRMRLVRAYIHGATRLLRWALHMGSDLIAEDSPTLCRVIGELEGVYCQDDPAIRAVDSKAGAKLLAWDATSELDNINLKSGMDAPQSWDYICLENALHELRAPMPKGGQR